MGLISLVYVSVESYPMTDADLKAILETARDFNSKNGISGMLLYRDGFFIQALEGEESVVMALYERIRQDDRHKNVLLVYKNDIRARSFQQWSMGFNKIGDDIADSLPGFNRFLEDKADMAFFTSQPSRATHLLELFKDRIYF